MRWTLPITILVTLAAASALATVPSAVPPPGSPAGAAQGAAGQHTGRVASAHSSTLKTSTRKPPAPRNKSYENGYRHGFVAGHSAALQQASRLRCPAPAAPSAAPHAEASTIRPLEAPSSLPSDLPLELAPGRHAASGGVPTALTSSTPRAGTKALRGSFNSLERQNEKLEQEGMERIEDQRDLEARINHRLLVPLPASTTMVVNVKLPADRRYCRPWTAKFLTDLAAVHDQAFHSPIRVNSAVRTVAYQKRLMASNGNAAPAVGDVVSPHLTGAAVDIAKDGLSKRELAWLRSKFLALQKSGKIDVEEEFSQACFHVTVYKNYMPGPAPGKPVRQLGARARTASLPSPGLPSTAIETPASVAAPARPRSVKPRTRPPILNQPTEIVVEGH